MLKGTRVLLIANRSQAGEIIEAPDGLRGKCLVKFDALNGPIWIEPRNLDPETDFDRLRVAFRSAGADIKQAMRESWLGRLLGFR